MNKPQLFCLIKNLLINLHLLDYNSCVNEF